MLIFKILFNIISDYFSKNLRNFITFLKKKNYIYINIKKNYQRYIIITSSISITNIIFILLIKIIVFYIKLLKYKSENLAFN